MIDIRFQSLVLFVAISSSSSDLIYYLVLFLLLLLSGDVELNPGPMIDDQPSCISFAQYFKALIDWKPFALCLPGITQSDVSIVTTKKVPLFRMVTLCKKWIEVNPTASWRDVINALKQCKENELARTIEGRVTEQPSVNDNFKNTSPDKRIEPIEGKNSINENSIVLEKEKSSTDIDSNGDTRSTSGANSNNESISTAEEENGSTHSSNHDTARGDHPNEILRTHYYELVHAISEPNLCNITVTLHTKELIPQQTKEEMLVLGVTNKEKSSKLI
ncbi:PREDICTED: uncharacterized protein LOC109583068 [Amphimedon queenslandica]|uniref:Death domain-containing protein n=1 Tax=Amphimedon queenslandica TaxID=400682 RepID=A0AAN0JAU7_AMPQE|nr:PREDICTED: uncharacterized protein LOC109583068 [Amphimedon queenslandica]|eukprot:XP_019853798.1 PREDICTED: uncharacterized protein LOC109583068 [Amphimedon queenslandica]